MENVFVVERETERRNGVLYLLEKQYYGRVDENGCFQLQGYTWKRVPFREDHAKRMTARRLERKQMEAA